jgi:hypothetical protein
MKPIETVAFGTLWVVLLALAGLVLVLYRQLDKAYRESTGAVSNALPRGTKAPPVAVLGDSEIEEDLTLPEGELAVLAFVTTACEACADLVKRLMSGEDAPSTRTAVLVTGEGYRDYVGVGEPRVTMHWIVSPADVKDDWRVSLVPMLYAVRDGIVLAASNDGSSEGVWGLLDEAGATGNGAGPSAADEVAASIAASGSVTDGAGH